MNVKLNQLEEKIRNSKCAICGLLLSVGPLMVMSEDGSQIRCGRCKEIECQTLARYTLYEDIAETLKFPCSYKKCKEMIPWGEVEEHEKACPFRTIYCPVYYQDCNDRIVEVADLQSHFNQAHKDNLQLGNYELSVSHYGAFLLIVDNQKFLVYLSNNSSNVLFGVFSLDPLGKLTKYNIKIRSDKSEDIVVLYRNQKIIQFNETEHCFKCWRKQCTLKSHPYSQAYTNSESLDLPTISHNLGGSLDNPEYFIFTVDLITDQEQQGSEDYTITTNGQCYIYEGELEEGAVDENHEKIDLPC